MKQDRSAREQWEQEYGQPVVGENWHDFILVQLRGVIDDGLAPCYRDVREFACDLWIGDVPWSEDDWRIVMRRIKEDERLPAIRQSWLKRFGYDFWLKVEEGLDDPD